MYPTLILLLDGMAISEINLDKEAVTIGRKEKNDLYIDDSAVSGFHAKVLVYGKDCFLEDLNSTNGTYVNGEAITKCVLSHQDKITIGKHELIYENEFAQGQSEEKETIVPASMTEYALSSGTEKMLEKSEPVKQKQTPPVVSDRKNQVRSGFKAELQMLSGANAGKCVSISKSLIRLGSPGDQMAAIQRRSSGCFVSKVGDGSGVPPRVNDQEIGVKAIALSDGDILEVGAVRMKYVQL